MGKVFARIFSDAGMDCFATDLPENLEELRKEFANSSLKILENGGEVVSSADYILFCVETEKIASVVASVSPFFTEKKIVGGQTSVKYPEILAFDTYLPADTEIFTLHSLHGPQVDPKGQTLALIPERCSTETYKAVVKIMEFTGSKLRELKSGEVHDKMMADIQVVTHIGFESIGTSFMHRGIFPWENPLHSSGLDNLKLLLTLRIFSYKYHVYSGMAMLNPFSKSDVRTYAQAENDIFGMMISADEVALEELIWNAKKKVFAGFEGKLMLNDELMAEFSLNPGEDHKPNSHLSLLAMVVTWARLGTSPYENLVCQTPPFKLRVGMAEYLFMNEALLKESIKTALFDLSIRKDDLAFHTAVQEWAHIVEVGDKVGYERHFSRTKAFLAGRLDEGRNLSTLLIERLNNEKG